MERISVSAGLLVFFLHHVMDRSVEMKRVFGKFAASLGLQLREAYPPSLLASALCFFLFFITFLSFDCGCSIVLIQRCKDGDRPKCCSLPLYFLLVLKILNFLLDFNALEVGSSSYQG